MLGRDSVDIEVDGERVVLRPSLRVAWRVYRDHGAFDVIARRVAEQHLETCCDLIRDHYDHVYLPNVVWSEVRAGELTCPLVRYIYLLAGVDPDSPVTPDEPTPPDQTKPVTLEDYFAKLFEIGTGWLGWTPEDTWNATPSEILAAHKGRCDMLRAVFGGGKAGDRTINDPGLSLDDKLRLAFAGRGTKIVQRKKAA